MRRITLTSRSLMVAAVALTSVLVATAFPLIAMASDGGPHGI